MDDLRHGWHDRFIRTVNDAAASAAGKQVSDLTDTEQFALAFLAGCQIACAGDVPGRTRHPVGFYKDGERFVVVEYVGARRR